MSSKEQSVTLLRRNKRAQVAALQDVGFTDITEDSKASEFARRIKWAGGLLDICIACLRKADRKKFYFTLEEWDTLTLANKSRFVFRGLRVRAYGHSFVIAAQDCIDENLGTAFVWGPSGNVTDLPGRRLGELYDDYEAEDNTSLIIASLAETSVGCPAATAARSYKAFLQGEEDGLEYDDDTVWNLPAMGHLWIMYVLREEINAVFRAIWGSDAELQLTTYWSSDYLDATNRWLISISLGQIYYSGTTTGNRVRPISEE